MKYILDTDILSYFLKQHPVVVKRIQAAEPDDVAITAINYAEILFGAYRSGKMAQKVSQIQAFLDSFMIIGFDVRAGKEFAKIKTALQEKGHPLADMDVMIASICQANRCTLVTNNTKHFEKIDGIILENWSVLI